MDASRMLAKVPLATLFSAVLTATCVSADARQSSTAPLPVFNSAPLPSFTAEQILSFPNDEQIFDRARLEFSEQGMKITRTAGTERQILLRSFVRNKAWLIDPRRSIQHEIRYESALSDSHSNSVDQPDTQLNKPTEVKQDVPLESGLLSPLPCMSFPRLKPLELNRWRGQIVSAWACFDELGRQLATDYFSKEWNLVIRSELIGFQTEELRGITALSFPEGHFEVNAVHAPVSLSELIHGTDVANRKYE